MMIFRPIEPIRSSNNYSKVLVDSKLLEAGTANSSWMADLEVEIYIGRPLLTANTHIDRIGGLGLFGKGHYYAGNRISLSQLLMLVVLRRGPMYGYEILKLLRAEFKGLWVPQTGSIYPALKRLTEHGLIRTEFRDDKEYYSLTEEGDSWVRNHLELMSIELLFMARYFDLINRAAIETNGQQERALDSSQDLPISLRFMIGEEMESKERLEYLRDVRNMLCRSLENIEIGIAELEKANKEE
jgi:DNA-binding PadR family transcriptional regulator